MSTAVVGICTVQFHLPGITSLKAKRSILKSMLARLQNSFNVSVAETNLNDIWQSAEITIAAVSNSQLHARQILQTILEWIEENFPDEIIIDHYIEIV